MMRTLIFKVLGGSAPSR